MNHRYRSFVLAFSVVLGLFVVWPLGARALEPPRPGELARFRHDGSLATRERFARSLGNEKVAPQLVQGVQARLRRAQLGLASSASAVPYLPPPAWRGMPTTGNVKVLTLLISFRDYPPTSSTATIADKLYGAGDSSEYPYESLSGFYERSSLGKLHITGQVFGWYRVPYDREAVPQTDEGRESLIEEALRSYEATNDLSQFDNDGDGAIDYLVVVWTGPDTGWSGFWWGYMTNFGDAGFTVDGKRLGTYSWQWESRPAGGSYDPAVVIHETGHALGLPDYYDYDDSVGPRGGVGGLDMMDANWGDHNCFSKLLLGWIEPQTIAAGSQSFSQGAAAAGGDAVAVMPSLKAADPFAEYFMVQNRRPIGNDALLPGDGLLVWHVDARLDAEGNDFVYDNSYAAHKLLRLMEADGLEHIEKNGLADPGDYYAAGRIFGPTTTPSSRDYGGASTGITLGDIGPNADPIAFSLGVDTTPDTTPPSTRCTADAKWHRTSVAVVFAARDDGSGVASTRFNYDARGWTIGSSLLVAAPKTHANDGVHTIQYFSTDNAGNVEQTKRCTVSIDTLGPITVASRASGTKRRYVNLSYRVKDVLSPLANVTIRIKSGSGAVVKTVTAKGVRTNRALTKRILLSMPAGAYRFFVYARDLAGNTQTVVGSSLLTVRAPT